MSALQVNPFKDIANGSPNACLSNQLESSRLAHYYTQAADALVEAAIADHGKLDVLVSPICFLYRHVLELTLKDLLWAARYVIDGTRDAVGGHRLSPIWRDLLSAARHLLARDFPLSNTEVEQLDTFFKRVDSHDPQSDAFRYTTDRRGQRTHQSLSHVNLAALRSATTEALELLSKPGYLIEYLEGQRLESEHE